MFRKKADNLTVGIEKTIERGSDENVEIKTNSSKSEHKIIEGKTYENIITVRKEWSDIEWVTGHGDSVPIFYEKEKNHGNIANSDAVKATIEILAENNVDKKRELESQARSIVTELCHNRQLHWVRWTGLVLSRLVRRLYSGVWVNIEGVERLRSAMSDCPVILLPSHRSYADFLTVSFVLFHYDLTLPAIAAGMDFHGMAGVGTVLRKCGAFFIRRKFGGDKLYWAVVKEYIQTLILSGTPVEFFIEGTRSRSGKCLPPKSGLMSIAVETFLSGRVHDIALVPVSIDYDRVLEETLFAFENLGIPKPPESTSGLFKALRTLNENYGNIHMTFGDPIFMSSKILRNPALKICPRKFSDAICQDMLSLLQQNSILSTFSVIASILSAYPDKKVSSLFLKTNCDLIVKLLEISGHRICGSEVFQDMLHRTIGVHKSLVKMDKNGLKVCQEFDSSLYSTELMMRCIPHLKLRLYSNPVIQALLPFTLLTSSLTVTSQIESLSHLLHSTKSLLLLEFPVMNSWTALQLCDLLSTMGLVSVADQSVCLNNCEMNKFLNRLIYPVLKQYQTVLNYLAKWGLGSSQQPRQILDNIRKREEGNSLAYPLCIHLQNMKTYQNILEFCFSQHIIEKTCNEWQISDEKLTEYSDLLNNLVIGMESFDTTIGVEKGSYTTVFKAKSKL